MAIYILVILIFSVILGVAATWRTMADAPGVDQDSFFYKTSQLILDNWCDGFIGSIVFTAGDPYMYIDGIPVEIDPGTGTAPVVINNQKFLPVCVLVEATGGQSSFDPAEKRLTIYYEQAQVMELHIGSYTIYDDGNLYYINEAPILINNNTMLSADVIAKNLGFEFDWNPATQELTLTRDFQTRRLIAKATADVDFSNIGATDIISGPGNITVLQFASIREAKSAFYQLHGLSYVDWVEPDFYLPPPPVKDVFVYDYLATFSAHRSWGVERSGLNRLAELLRNNNRNRQVIVAVIDTGVQSNHPFLQGRIMSGWCAINNNAVYYDVQSHGTNVAGVIVDATPGLNVQILPVRVFNSRGGTVLTLTNGVRWATSRSHVINISVGGRDNHYWMLYDAVMHALGRNTIVVAAAGNSAIDARHYTPGNVPGIITVAATNRYGAPASFTNWGPAITLSAPGVGINAASRGGGFVTENGTSLAAPHVAAAVAMYLMCNPGICPANMQAILRQYAYVPAGWNNRFGAGILDMSRVIPCNFTEPCPYNNPVIIPGNVTGSGRVTAADVAMLRAYLAGYPVDIIREAADVNGDGFITAADVALIRAYLAGYPVTLTKAD